MADHERNDKRSEKEKQKENPNKPCKMWQDRRKALRRALENALTLRQDQGPSNKNVVVLVTGKGTDPYIMGPNNTKITWDDASVTREELSNLVNSNKQL